jgi:hypothetical protein
MSFLQAFELPKRFTRHDNHFFTDDGQVLRELVRGCAGMNQRSRAQEQQR